MSQRNPLDFLFDTSVGSGSSKLDELLGIRPITEEERAANRARYEEPTPEIPSMQGDAREKMAWAKQYLESKGLPSHLAAGALGNVMAESGGRTSAVGDAGASVGAFQWQKERLHGGGYTGLMPKLWVLLHTISRRSLIIFCMSCEVLSRKPTSQH